MSFSIMAILAITTFKFFSFAGTGGTMVGNGGGFAEMQAVYLDQKLPVYLSLSGEHQKFAAHLRQNTLAPLHFSSDCPGLSYCNRVLADNNSGIPSCLLYTEAISPLGLQPKSLPEIGALVFAHRYYNFDPETSWTLAYQKGSEFFDQFKLRQKKWPMTWRSQHVASLIFWQVISKSIHEEPMQLSLELPQQTHDLGPMLKSATKCFNEPDFQLSYISLETFGNNKFFARGPVTWQCDGSRYQGQLYLYYDSANDELVSVSIKQRQEIP